MINGFLQSITLFEDDNLQQKMANDDSFVICTILNCYHKPDKLDITTIYKSKEKMLSHKKSKSRKWANWEVGFYPKLVCLQILYSFTLCFHSFINWEPK